MSENSNNNTTNSGNNGNNGNNPKPVKPAGSNKPKFNGYWIYIALALFFIGINFFKFNDPPKELDWNQFSVMIAEQKVTKLIVVNKEKVEIFVKADTTSSATGITEKTKKRGFGQFTTDGPKYVFNIQYPDQPKEINDLITSLPLEKRPEFKTETRSALFNSQEIFRNGIRVPFNQVMKPNMKNSTPIIVIEVI